MRIFLWGLAGGNLGLVISSLFLGHMVNVTLGTIGLSAVLITQHLTRDRS